jgi:hypothetical protein
MKNLLACRPRPLSDEMLSSWVLRTALHNGMKPQSFCKMLWPDRAFWNRSLDRYIALGLLEELSAATAIPIEHILNLSLNSYKGVLFSAVVRNGNTPWILPLGIYHRRFRRAGLVYCPHCLAEGEPYFRRRWRLSFATMCLLHQSPLQESCPQCLMPIQPHRVEIGSGKSYTSRPIYMCSSCSMDLRAAFADASPPPLLRDLEEQSWNLLHQTSSDPTPIVDHFAVLRRLLGMLSSRRARLLPFRSILADDLSEPLLKTWSQHGSIKLSFDAMPLASRRIFLTAAYWLLEDWPNQFIYAARRANLRSSDLTRDFPSMPTSYRVIATAL